MKKPKNSDDKKSILVYFARYSGLAFEMLGIIALGTWGGIKLDEHYSGEFPLWTLVLSLFSVFVALYLVLKDLLRNGTKPK
ncbi:MAG: AtpZ/AtpI family protein [Salinivirgaceae bacterium]